MSFEAQKAQRRAQRIANHIAPPLPAHSATTPQACSAGSSTPKPVRVVVTGAAGQIGYALLPLIASGQMFGSNQPVILHLLEVEQVLKALNGVVMELIDSAFPLLVGIVATADAAVGFRDVDAAVLVGAFPRKQGMERSDLLAKNAAIFEAQGKAIEKYASRNVKVLVVGNPANTNCLIARHFAPSIPEQNWSALTRLDHHRAAAQIAQKLNVLVKDVKNVTIWGNHSATQYPDANHAYVKQADGSKKPVTQLLDTSYLEGPFVPTVQKRGAEVIAARGSSSALSAAIAIAAHMRDWWLGTAPGEWVSMGVVSDGSYGTPKGLVFSFPVTISGGKWSIVQGLAFNEFGRKAVKVTTDELLQEKDLALAKRT